MSSLTLALHDDSLCITPLSLTQGETIRGDVVFCLDEHVNLIMPVVELCADLKGTHASVEAVRIHQSLPAGRLHQGEHTVPFELTVPEDAPPSFRDQELEVVWSLRAKAFVQHGEELRQDVPVKMKRAQEALNGPEKLYGKAFESRVEEQSDRRATILMYVVLGVLFLGMLVFMIYVDVVLDEASWLEWAWLLVIPIALSSRLNWRSLFNLTATEALIRSSQFRVTPGVPRAGHACEVSVEFVPSAQLHLNQCFVTLKCWHQSIEALVAKDIGVRMSYPHREIATLDVALELAKPLEFAKGEQGCVKGHVVIPEGLPASIESDIDHIVWALEVKMDIPNWPDWSYTQVIQVA